MKKCICLSMVIFLFGTHAFAEASVAKSTYLPFSSEDFITIEWQKTTEYLKADGKVSFSVCVFNKGVTAYGSVRWYVNGSPVAEFAQDGCVFDTYAIFSMKTTIPYVHEHQETQIAFEAVVDGFSRYLTMELPNYPYTDAEWYGRNLDALKNQLLPGGVPCTVRQTQVLYTEPYGKERTGVSALSGATVYMIDHRNQAKAKIRTPEGQEGWVNYNALSISSSKYTDDDDWSEALKTDFVNAMGYDSQTDYLVFISLKKQSVSVFLGEQYHWKMIRTHKCATGANRTPTPQVEYEYQYLLKSGWKNDGHWVYPVMYLDTKRGIALHSILYYYNGALMDGTMGRPASLGCIRLKQEDINWLADYIPPKTKVVIY